MKRHALFVGVDQYADPTIQNLNFSSEDATELASAFKLLLKFNRVEKLLNPAHSADVVDVVKDMTHGLGPGDLFLFFFAGHGFRVKENHVLVCAKDEYAELEDEYAGLPVGQLKKRMRGPWNRMLVFDACQNDIRATRGADMGATGRDLKLIHTSNDDISDSGCQIIVTACSEGQKALEVSDLGHGLFTSAFLDSVTAFVDASKRIDLEALRADIGVRMGGLITKYRLSGQQEPLFTMPANAAGIVLLDGIAAPMTHAPEGGETSSGGRHGTAAPAYVVCPVCGKKNRAEDTFKCRECGRDNLCLEHRDKGTFLCKDCAAKEAERKAKERAAKEAAERAEEEAVRKSALFRLASGRAETSEKRRRLRWVAVIASLIVAMPVAFLAINHYIEERQWKQRQKMEQRLLNRPVEVFHNQPHFRGEAKIVAVGSQTIALRWCPAGSFTMGDEVVRRRVTLTKGFWMGESEVTQGLWMEVMGTNPSYNKAGDNYPVEEVSWDACREFVEKLNLRYAQNGLRWALPTEAQWEYACRAGRTGAYGGTGHLNDMGWYHSNNAGKVHPVRQKKPNAWGLYDMHGNVWEWCADWYGDYPSGTLTDPTGPSSGSERVLRGGSWRDKDRFCCSDTRFRCRPNERSNYIGIRVALIPVKKMADAVQKNVVGVKQPDATNPP